MVVPRTVNSITLLLCTASLHVGRYIQCQAGDLRSMWTWDLGSEKGFFLNLYSNCVGKGSQQSAPGSLARLVLGLLWRLGQGT